MLGDLDSWGENDKVSKYCKYIIAVKSMKELSKAKKLTVKKLDQYLWMAMKTKCEEIEDKK